MNKTKEEKQLDKIKEIAFRNGWKVGNHVFNYLTENQMHQYDTLQRVIDLKRALNKQAEDIKAYFIRVGYFEINSGEDDFFIRRFIKGEE